jgi:phosphatidylserine/phosphatidylglycerophosphate/cardiolipin synthase-like enzyme
MNPTTENERDNEYRRNVEFLMEQRSGELISNGMTVHGAILIETFLKHAKERVVIFCRNLAKDAYNRVTMLANMETALRKGVQVDIISQSDPESEALVAAVDQWKKDSKMKVTLNVLRPEENAAHEKLAGLPINFAVMDRRAYRFEPDHGAHKAVASMNRPAEATQLEELFYSLSASAF